HAHLHLHGAECIEYEAEHLQNNHTDVSCNKGVESVQCSLFNKVIDDIALKQRQQYVYNRDNDVGDDDEQKQPAIGFRKRKQPLPDGKLKGLVALQIFVTVWISH